MYVNALVAKGVQTRIDWIIKAIQDLIPNLERKILNALLQKSRHENKYWKFKEEENIKKI